jgi:serine/threonine protein phosphatase 1
MTRYAIGDIHGGVKTFRALLNKIVLGRDDRLYLLGDYVDRGPDSKGVLDTILCLQEIGFDVRPVRGNHDDLLLRNITGKHDIYSNQYMNNWGFETLLSFGVMSPVDIPDEYKTFLENLPYLLEDENFIFVHASLDMTAYEPLKATLPEIMLWGNAPIPTKSEIPGKTVVSGHRIRTLDQIHTSLHSAHIQIDNGAFSNDPPHLGHLIALNLDNKELTIQPWLDGDANI